MCKKGNGGPGGLKHRPDLSLITSPHQLPFSDGRQSCASGQVSKMKHAKLGLRLQARPQWRQAVPTRDPPEPRALPHLDRGRFSIGLARPRGGNPGTVHRGGGGGTGRVGTSFKKDCSCQNEISPLARSKPNPHTLEVKRKVYQKDPASLRGNLAEAP